MFKFLVLFLFAIGFNYNSTNKEIIEGILLKNLKNNCNIIILRLFQNPSLLNNTNNKEKTIIINYYFQNYYKKNKVKTINNNTITFFPKL
jgi:hypothetical protein